MAPLRKRSSRARSKKAAIGIAAIAPLADLHHVCGGLAREAVPDTNALIPSTPFTPPHDRDNPTNYFEVE